jgi:hypothetical protein
MTKFVSGICCASEELIKAEQLTDSNLDGNPQFLVDLADLLMMENRIADAETRYQNTGQLRNTETPAVVLGLDPKKFQVLDGLPLERLEPGEVIRLLKMTSRV